MRISALVSKAKVTGRKVFVNLLSDAGLGFFFLKIKKNGFWFFVILALRRIRAIFRGRFYNYILEGTHGFELGEFPKIRGKGYISIGQGCRFGDFFWLEAIDDYFGQKLNPKIFFGDGVVVNDFVHIAAVNSVKIGNGCLIASKVLIIDHSHGIYKGEGQSLPTVWPISRKLASGGEVVIGENVWLGEYVSVLPGAKIGDGVIVGANSTVVGELPSNTICVGSPARPIKVFSFVSNSWVSIESMNEKL